MLINEPNLYYNAFKSIFQGHFRLFCYWHVEKSWKENLSKKKGKKAKVLGKYNNPDFKKS